MFGFKRLRTYAGKTFSVSEWMAKDALVAGARNIKSLYHAMKASQSGRKVETFQEAVERLGLREKDIATRLAYYKKTSLLYGVILVASVLYAAMMYSASQWLTFLTCVAYSLLVFSFFFREHFWYMQIKKRRFGMRFSDWLRFVTFRL